MAVESQLQGKTIRWVGHVFRMPNDRLRKQLLFGEIKGLRPHGRPRSSFNDVAWRVKLVDLAGMRKADCFGETRLVLHVPSSS